MNTPHHLGYFVSDLPTAIGWAERTLGAGPFHLIEHLEFDEVTFDGEPAAYDHSSAFGRFGPLLIELTVIHSASPGLDEALSGPLPRLGHLGFLADDLEAEAPDLPRFHTGRAGPVTAHWYDARATLGHHVEILQRSPELLAFYERIRSS